VSKSLMKKKNLISHVLLEHSNECIHLEFTQELKVLSSAVYNGGLVSAHHLLNLKVPLSINCHEKPESSLQNYADSASWHGCVVGMMTAASMKSFAMQTQTVQEIEIAVLVTSGLSNARCVGDKAEYRHMLSDVKEVGTINIIILTSATLSEAAMAEILMIVTEAKVLVMYELGINSTTSGKIATGTGTDSVAVVSGVDTEPIRYAGKHTLFGELLGKMVISTLKTSIDEKIEYKF